MPLKLKETNISNEHNRLKNPNKREADQLAICRHDRGVKLGSTEKQLQLSGQSQTPHTFSYPSVSWNTILRIMCFSPMFSFFLWKVLEEGSFSNKIGELGNSVTACCTEQYNNRYNVSRESSNSLFPSVLLVGVQQKKTKKKFYHFFSCCFSTNRQARTTINMNRREIWSDIKRKLPVRIKMGWKHYQTVDPRKREPQVARGLFGIRLLILHFKSSTFHIFLNLTYPLRKNISFPKCPNLTQKFTQNHQTVVNEISREI